MLPALSPRVIMEPSTKERRPKSQHSLSSRQKRPSLGRATAIDALSIFGVLMSARVVGSYDPYHIYRPNSAAVKSNKVLGGFSIGYMLNTTSLENHLSKVLDVLRTSLLHIAKKNETEGNLRPEISSLPKAIHYTRFFEDPPPLLFIAACISFVVTVAAVRYSHRNDRYQDRIIVGGAVIGIIEGYQSQNMMTETKRNLAWSISLGLMFSLLVHRVINLWPDPHIPESLEAEERLVDPEKVVIE